MFSTFNLKYKNIKLIFLTFNMFLVAMISAQTDTYSTSYTCTTTNPSTPDTCYNQSTNAGNLCCYIQGIQNYSTDRMCLSIPSDSYLGESTTRYNGKEYSISCKTTTTPALLSSCGTSSAGSQSDCATSSSYTNSCCYFSGFTSTSNKSATPAGCYWLGTKYSGTVTWAGLSLNCAGDYITYSTYILFALIALLF